VKVLLLQSELGVLRGGGENFTRNLFAAFVERGHEVVAAFTAGPGGRYPLPLPTGMVAVPLSGIWAPNPGQAGLAWAARWLPSDGRARAAWNRVQEGLSWRAFALHNRRFQRTVERRFAGLWERFDAVYVHGSTRLAHAAARHRPTLLRLPGPVDPALAPLLAGIHAVCANGDALVRLRAFLGDKVLELPIGLDLGCFSRGGRSMRAALGWRPDDFVIGYVGRLIHLKGVDLLAAAFRDLGDAAGRAKLLIVGTGDQQGLVGSVLAAARARGAVRVEPGVAHEELPAWYRAMDLLVMPSRYENHSNALLEGLACGVPFLASDVGGNVALARSGAGRLFPGGSAAALAEALGRLMADRSELEEMRRATAQAVDDQRGWGSSARRLEEILNDCLSPPACEARSA
jgi:glycosyltransferase involved in cell wall biosynthesis